MPTERELALEMETSRTTVRQALGELVVEGRLVRRQGSGTYVAEPKITWPLYVASFTEQVNATGFTPSAECWARRGSPPAPTSPSDSGSAHGPPSTSSSASGSPTTGRSRSRPRGCLAKRFPGLTRLIRTHGSLHAMLASHYGTSMHTGDESIETAPATPREAGPLRVDVGTPMLVVSRQNFDSEGTPVEFGRTWFRGDRVTLVTRLGSKQ